VKLVVPPAAIVVSLDQRPLYAVTLWVVLWVTLCHRTLVPRLIETLAGLNR
jgi:hypothetical protein